MRCKPSCDPVARRVTKARAHTPDGDSATRARSRYHARMELADILAVLREVAPESLAESWDKVGLQVGAEDARIRRALLCIDLTEPVMAEAVARECDLIVAYHPPIFAPLTQLTERTWKERVIIEAVRRRIAIYSPHTALDNVRGGITDWLCDGLGEHELRTTIVDHVDELKSYKVVTYAPTAVAEQMRTAMRQAGAGGRGDDDHAYHTQGYATMGSIARPENRHETGNEPGAPSFGHIDQMRVEMTCAPKYIGDVMRAIRHAHPEKEPIIDLYRLASELPAMDDAPGAGRVHHLAHPITVDALIKRIKRRLQLEHLKLAVPPPGAGKREGATGEMHIRTIAVCPGAGGSLFERYPGADAYFTGEMRHHQVLEMSARGQVVVLGGHTNTERPYLPVYRDRLVAAGGDRVEWLMSESDRVPLAVY